MESAIGIILSLIGLFLAIRKIRQTTQRIALKRRLEELIKEAA